MRPSVASPFKIVIYLICGPSVASPFTIICDVICGPSVAFTILLLLKLLFIPDGLSPAIAVFKFSLVLQGFKLISRFSVNFVFEYACAHA